MYIKKTGYVLLESIVILMVIACICIMLNNIVINNNRKLKVINSKDDIKTLTITDERVLLGAIDEFNRDRSKNKYIINDITITINGDKGMLTKKSGLNEESYVELKCIKSDVSGNEILNLVPKVYKTDYISH